MYSSLTRVSRSPSSSVCGQTVKSCASRAWTLRRTVDIVSFVPAVAADLPWIKFGAAAIPRLDLRPLAQAAALRAPRAAPRSRPRAVTPLHFYPLGVNVFLFIAILEFNIVRAVTADTLDGALVPVRNRSMASGAQN